MRKRGDESVVPKTGGIASNGKREICEFAFSTVRKVLRYLILAQKRDFGKIPKA